MPWKSERRRFTGIRGLAVLAFALLMAAPLARAVLFTGYTLQNLSNTTLAPGLDLWAYSLRGSGEEPLFQRLHVLETDPRKTQGLKLMLAGKNGQIHGLQKTTDSMIWLASRHPDLHVLAGINGDFFDTSAGGPLGLTMQAGRLMMTSEFPKAWVFGLTADGRACIGRPQVQLSFSAMRQGQEVMSGVRIDALNCLRADIEPGRSTPGNAWQARQDNELVVYTRDWYRSTMAPDGGYEVRLDVTGDILPNRRLLGKVSGIYGTGKTTLSGSGQVPQGTALSQSTMVLSATGRAVAALRQLQMGDAVSVDCVMSPDWADIFTCLGGGRPDGGPLLVMDGQIQPDDRRVEDYSYFYVSHPRTLAGIRKDGSYFFVVADGYAPGEASGLTVQQLAQIALDLGADIALNLDGGPSSTMAVRQGEGFTVISSSTGSSGSETRVGNSLVFCERR